MVFFLFFDRIFHFVAGGRKRALDITVALFGIFKKKKDSFWFKVEVRAL